MDSTIKCLIRRLTKWAWQSVLDEHRDELWAKSDRIGWMLNSEQHYKRELARRAAEASSVDYAVRLLRQEVNRRNERYEQVMAWMDAKVATMHGINVGRAVAEFLRYGPEGGQGGARGVHPFSRWYMPAPFPEDCAPVQVAPAHQPFRQQALCVREVESNGTPAVPNIRSYHKESTMDYGQAPNCAMETLRA